LVGPSLLNKQYYLFPSQVQAVLLLDLHIAVDLAPVVWTYLMEDTATVIESALPLLITIAALTIPVTVCERNFYAVGCLTLQSKAMNY